MRKGQLEGQAGGGRGRKKQPTGGGSQASLRQSDGDLHDKGCRVLLVTILPDAGRQSVGPTPPLQRRQQAPLPLVPYQMTNVVLRLRNNPSQPSEQCSTPPTLQPLSYPIDD